MIPIRSSPAVLAGALLAAACATAREDRISRSREFPKYPPETQERLREGRVEVGDTEAMVLLAAGEPDRRATRRSQAGNEEVWTWTTTRARSGLGLGVGVGTSQGGVGYGLSAGIGPGEELVERLRVVLRAGRVVAVELPSS